jgi:diguanylate cyclase (GGDEF)-like protein/PAS domain S-box-containing protein
MLKTVKVPKQFLPIFEKAQEYVQRYFQTKKEEPSKGTIEIFGERYILVRAASLSVDFFETVTKLYEKEGKEEASNIARQFLFDIAHTIGKQDARNFHTKMNLKDPIEKLSAGPIHFSHSGWAFVDIFPESNPSPDENYYLIYDHPYSFESAAWMQSGKKSDFPVCIMNAGYSSGWSEESFGIPLVASEIMCQAKGDNACRFIMAPPSQIQEHIDRYIKKEPKIADKIIKYEIPDLFKRIELEVKLRDSETYLKAITENIQAGLIIIDAENHQIIDVNKVAVDLIGVPKEEIIGKECHQYICPAERGKCPVTDLNQVVDKSERVLINAKGENIPILKTVVTLMIQQRKYILDSFIDISERKLMEEELRRLSITDNLTQTYNRTKHEEIIKRETERTKRYLNPLSISMFDIDHFKAVNDTFGHNVGDYVLKTIAQIVKNSLRELDYLVRWGGEEFLIIAPDTTVRGAEIMAERIRKLIESYKFDKVDKLTVSFGVTQFKEDENQDTFIKRADDAMYQAKEKGRNRVEVSD